MAITVTPRQMKVLVDTLNDRYARDKKENTNVRVDSLPEDQKEPPLEKLYEKEAGNEPFMDRVNKLREQVGPEKTDAILRHYVQFDQKGWNEPPDKEPAPDAFYSVPAPKEVTFPIPAYEWQMKEKGGPSEDSEVILKKMSPEERDWFFKKLDFPAVWTDPGEGEIGLYGRAPAQKKVFNARFEMEKFLKQAGKIVERPQKKGLVDKEALIENFVELLDAKCEEEEQLQDDPDNLSDEYGYAAQDVKDKKWEDLLKAIDDENIVNYIEKLLSRGIKKSEIREMLAESADEEYSDSMYSVDNSIGSTSLSSETELYLDNRDGWVEDPKWPYPGDFDQNLALLNKDDLEKIRKGVHNGSVRFSYDEASHQYTIDSVTVYLGDNRSVHLVVNEKKFILAASRKLKDMMLKPPRKKKELGASVERFPAIGKVLQTQAD